MKLIRYFQERKALLVGLLATAYLAVMLPVYAWQEPIRLQNTELGILTDNLDDAMTTYAENCSMCHGMAGEGIGPNPALNNPGLAQSSYDDLFKVIEYGRSGTTMVGWAEDTGGPLNDYQISQLVALVQMGNWDTTQDRVVNLGLQPLIPFAADPDPVMLDQVAALPNGTILMQGIQVYAEQCVACHGADGIGTKIAPPLNDTELRATPVDDIRRAIVQGVPGTLMAGWERILPEEDIAALMTLILGWDTIPSGTIPEPEIPIHVTEESLALGEDLYSSYCSRCHGPEGQGTPRAPALNVKGFLEDTNDQAIEQIISYGVPETTMIAWETRLSLPDIQAIVGFIRAWEPTAPEVAEPVRGVGQGSQGGGPPSGQGGPPWMRDGYSETE